MTASQIASTIFALVEKYLGTGFDSVTDSALVNTVAEYLEEEVLKSSTLSNQRPIKAVSDKGPLLRHAK
jgi:hypothetical protein